MKYSGIAKAIIFLSFFFSLYTIYHILHTKPVRALNMSSDSYEIQMGNLNMTSGRKTGGGNVLTDTVGQTAPGEYISNGYKVLAGFQYINSIIPFSFTISDLSISFGSLIPGIPSTLTNTLTVVAGSAGGWQVTTMENHELRTPTGTAEIDDTSCNGGAQTCSISDANLWDDNGQYGFGYNLSGENIDADDFVNSDYYRPFANDEDDDSPVTIMSSEAATRSATATVTYKVNISALQTAGNYQNYLTFVATPTY